MRIDQGGSILLIYASLIKRPAFAGLFIKEPADKPGSVLGNHSSGSAVTSSLERPTRRHRGPRLSLPIWSCFGWGLPSRSVLPPARCALTAPFHPYLQAGGLFSVALSVGSRPPGVTWHPALRSPDFPRYGFPQRDCLAGSGCYFPLLSL